MEDKNVIYGLYCICEECKHRREWIRYVGQTRVGMTERMRGHLKPYRSKQPYPVDRWKAKHGRHNIRYRVLETLQSPECLDVRERYWIEYYQTFADWGKGGLNFTLGGQGWEGRAQEVIEKIRAANSRDTVPWAKIDSVKAKAMREEYLFGEPTRKLAEKYGISRGHVWSILQNRVWPDAEYKYQKVEQPPIKKEDRGSYLLSREQADEMRARYKSSDRTYDEVAEEFNVSTGVVIKVLNNHAYYDPNYTPGRPMPQRQRDQISRNSRGKKKPEGHGAKVSSAIRGSSHGMSKLTEEKVVEIRELRKSGLTSKELAEMFGVNPNQITRICSGTRWGHIREGLDD